MSKKETEVSDEDLNLIEFEDEYKKWEIRNLHIDSIQRSGLLPLLHLVEKHLDTIKYFKIPMTALPSLVEICYKNWDKVLDESLKLVYNSKQKKFIEYNPLQWDINRKRKAEFEKYWKPKENFIREREKDLPPKKLNRLVYETRKKEKEQWLQKLNDTKGAEI